MVKASILLRMENTPRPSSTALHGFQAPSTPWPTRGDGHPGRSPRQAPHVTKGSFYWHFKDRQDLLGVLGPGRNGRIRDIIKQTPRPGRNEAQIFHVIDVYSASRKRKGI